MSDKKRVFDSVIIDQEDKTFTVLDGSVGTYALEDIKHIQILGEHARKRGKTPPFTYMVLLANHYRTAIFEPSFYVGLKIDMKNGDVIAIYLSKKKTYSCTDVARKAMAEGEKIRKIMKKYIKTEEEK